VAFASKRWSTAANEGRSCVYVPITHNGKVVDSHGFNFDPDDE
jgi:hypothetical protein